jgi:hypothetical protein
MTDPDIDLAPATPDTPANSRTALLIGLGFAAAVATVLVIYARAAGRIVNLDGTIQVDATQPWQVSMQHLADAFTVRCANLESRLEMCEQMILTKPMIGVDQPVEVPPNTEIPPAIETLGGGEPQPPARPAAVSLPDLEPPTR